MHATLNMRHEVSPQLHLQREIQTINVMKCLLDYESINPIVRQPFYAES